MRIVQRVKSGSGFLRPFLSRVPSHLTQRTDLASAVGGASVAA